MPMFPSYSSVSGDVTSFWRTALWFALFIAFLGFLPHALFSLNVGEWHYMNNAWDEDSYTGYALLHKDVMYRVLGATILRGFIAWFGLDWALIGFDVLFPFCSALIACGIAYRAGFKTQRSMFLASCLLLFALEFLALCNASMIGSLTTQLLPFSSLVYPSWIRMWVPSMYENFFNLYKSPEPQITFIVHFAVLYCLLRHAQTMRVRYIGALLALALALPFIYISTGIALLLAMGMYAVAGLVMTRDRRFIWVLAGALFAVAYYLYRFFGGPPLEHSDGFVFASHLPIFSVSMLWGVALLWVYVKQCKSHVLTRVWCMECTPQTMLGLVCCVLPFITLNQQLITGVMVQSRTWEYYTNLTFTGFAILLLWPAFSAYCAPFMPRRLRSYAHMAAPVLAGILVAAQLGNFMKYTRGNTDNVAVAQALEELRADYPNGLPNLMLENTGDDSQIMLRTGTLDTPIIAGYQQTISHFVATLSAGEQVHAESIATLKEHGFAYFDRLGLTSEVLEARMRTAATKAMGGLELIYFFSYLDNWKPLSDYREHNVAGMQEKIPSMIADYRTFLKSTKRRNQFGELLFVTRNPREARADVPWKETLVVTRTLGIVKPVTIYIYRQTPR